MLCPAPQPCRQGHFDPPESLPWAGLDTSVIGSPPHVATAREIAVKGCVLLKNEGVSLWTCCWLLKASTHAWQAL